VTLTTELKQNFYKEILSAIAYLKRKSYVDPNKIALFGESRGGYNTLRAKDKGL
jgi:dipeptidyl aminopeptidase/acylaminoacyl peptidase